MAKRAQLMDDELFKYLDRTYTKHEATSTWWAALEDAVRAWNKEHSANEPPLNPTAAVNDYLHRKAQEKRR